MCRALMTMLPAPKSMAGWKLSDYKTVVAKQAESDKTLEIIRAKLGANWSMVCDWASIFKNYPDELS